MFLFLSKFIPQFLYPLGLAFTLLLVGVFLYKRPRAQRAALLIAVLLLGLAGNRWVAGALIKSLEWQHLPPAEIPAAEAIVVLGGGTDTPNPPRPTVELNDAGDRVLYGAWLYHQGKAPLIVLTGGNLPWSNAPTSPASDMAAIMERLAVPPSALLLEGHSTNTYENALLTRDLLAPLGIHRILLVTSALHMPRSVALFEQLGFEVIPAPTDFIVTEQPGAGASLAELFLSLAPSPYSLANTTSALKEYLGLLAYWLRGWL